MTCSRQLVESGRQVAIPASVAWKTALAISRRCAGDAAFASSAKHGPLSSATFD